MKNAKLMDEDKLREKAIGLLMHELGPVETARFITMRPIKRMESVKRHRLWQATLNKDEFFKTVFDEKAWQRQTNALKRKGKTAVSSAPSPTHR